MSFLRRRRRCGSAGSCCASGYQVDEAFARRGAEEVAAQVARSRNDAFDALHASFVPGDPDGAWEGAVSSLFPSALPIAVVGVTLAGDGRRALSSPVDLKEPRVLVLAGRGDDIEV